jgi:hypothetical protein
VIVHRESEEYHDLDEVVVDNNDKTSMQIKVFYLSKLTFHYLLLETTSGSAAAAAADNSTDTIPHPVVRICVDSPKDEEQRSLAQTPDVERVILERSSLAAADSSNVNVDEPIDINLANTCDTSKVIYDY